MNQEIFVDSGAWIAVANPRDEHHANAVRFFSQLVEASRLLVTSNLVVAETYTLVLRTSGHARATRFLSSVRASARLDLVYSDHALEMKAADTLRLYADQDFSYVDAVSFAVMKDRSITEAFAFDHHFVIAGFSAVPAVIR